METKPYPDEPMPLSKAARRLRVPTRWMRDEVEAGRLPALRAGRSILFHLPTITKLLADRARQAGETGVRNG